MSFCYHKWTWPSRCQELGSNILYNLVAPTYNPKFSNSTNITHQLYIYLLQIPTFFKHSKHQSFLESTHLPQDSIQNGKHPLSYSHPFSHSLIGSRINRPRTIPVAAQTGRETGRRGGGRHGLLPVLQRLRNVELQQGQAHRISHSQRHL